MHRVGVSGGVHRDGLDSHLPRGANDAQGDLASVRYKDLVEHARALLDDHQGRAELDGGAVLDEDTLDRAGRGAGMWFMVFIASTISSVSPSDT